MFCLTEVKTKTELFGCQNTEGSPCSRKIISSLKTTGGFTLNATHFFLLRITKYIIRECTSFYICISIFWAKERIGRLGSFKILILSLVHTRILQGAGPFSAMYPNNPTVFCFSSALFCGRSQQFLTQWFCCDGENSL